MKDFAYCILKYLLSVFIKVVIGLLFTLVKDLFSIMLMDLLYKVVKEGYRLVVPRDCRQLLLDEAHCGPAGAHFGFSKTLKLLASRVWWPGMARHVKGLVRSC